MTMISIRPGFRLFVNWRFLIIFVGLLFSVTFRFPQNDVSVFTDRVAVYDIPPEASLWMSDEFDSRLTVSFQKNIHKFTSLSTAIVKDAIEKFNMQDLVDLLSANVAPHSAVLIRGLPGDQNIPPCPHSVTTQTTQTGRKPYSNNNKKNLTFLDVKETQVGEALLMAFGALAGGKPIGYTFEYTYSHPLVHDSCPRLDGSGSALTSTNEQQLHQDMAYLDSKMVPDILALMNVREGYDQTVTTDLLDNRDILQYVAQDSQEVLSQPRFIVKRPRWISAELTETPLPVLTGPKLAPSLGMHVEWMNVVAVDEKARGALDMLKRAIAKASKLHMSRIHSKAGDLIVFNNKRVLHRRSATKGLRGDGEDRTLLRSYFSKALDKVLVKKTR